MPVITTPFVLELHPHEEFFISRPVDNSAQITTNNDFSSILNSIIITEELPESFSDGLKPGKAKPQKQSKLNAASVRISLVVNMHPRHSDMADISTSSNIENSKNKSHSISFTLATYLFKPHLEEGELKSKAAKDEKNPKTLYQEVSADGSVVNGSSLALDLYHLTLKKKLLFNSDDTHVRSFKVLASAIEGMEDGNYENSEINSEKRLKSYRGPRRFVVRLMGIQQTVLTNAQATLFSS
ncbi:unnamed protein product [Phytomonas sp. Hart1]|nr:unnamed protein product [Phytomonas sp. Hart1]|eukprot:CCW71678.1 unnamed protein product [Phytomonas sp. isolate Hart1]